MKLSFKYRLLPNKRQHAALASILEAQRQLYNAGLQERIDAWRLAKKRISFFEQSKSLTIEGLAQSNVARSIHDAAWAQFKSMLAYKAERAGGLLIEVDPKFTSQDCSGCGERVPKALSVREHSCLSCGLVLDRDVNAAKNILHKAKLGLEAGNVAQWSERRLGNIGGDIRAPETISVGR